MSAGVHPPTNKLQNMAVLYSMYVSSLPLVIVGRSLLMVDDFRDSAFGVGCRLLVWGCPHRFCIAVAKSCYISTV
jgi:hypothetical protein